MRKIYTLMLCIWAGSLLAQTFTRPTLGAFYLMSVPDGPPLPFNPDPGCTVYTLASNNVFAVDDREVAAARLSLREMSEADMPPIPEDGETNSGDSGGGSFFPSFSFPTNGLWIELSSLNTNGAQLTLHNTEQNNFYQLLFTTDLLRQSWTVGQVLFDFDGSTSQVFSAVPTNGNDTMFFRGAEGSLVMGILFESNATRPTDTNSSGFDGGFTLEASSAPSSDLTVFYSVSGTATPGEDYTPLSGTVIVPAGVFDPSFDVHPLYQTNGQFDETVTVTLIVTNGYVVDPTHASATITILQSFDFEPVADITGVGIDYDSLLTNIVVSAEHGYGDTGYDFMRFGTNSTGDLTTTNWSVITGLQDEVKLCIVKQTAHGFTNGEMYFGTGVNGVIGKLSPNGSISNLVWSVLTTNSVTTESLIRGGLCIDQSGSFGGDLIVVTGNGPTEGGGVWRVNSTGSPTRLAEITNTHLEGVITLTNDSVKWGPWAGKIITGSESTTPPLIYAIGTNGTMTTFDLGIASEDFDLIPANQDLYATDFHNQIAKVSRDQFSSLVGDLLITQSGDGGGSGGFSALFVVHWDNVQSKFIVQRIRHRGGGSSDADFFEHVTFAPISLPVLPDE